MIFWILQRIIISLVLILCAHYIYIFLKNNLTTPKTRDLVNQPREKYKEMYEKINKSVYSNIVSDVSDVKTEQSQSKMKNELKNYLKDLKKSNNVLSSSNTNSNSNSFNTPVTDGSTSFTSALSDTGFSTY
jgi:ABC-type bacteriocin/lantibiotic exporter with double-glycine peptidase domain